MTESEVKALLQPEAIQEFISNQTSDPIQYRLKSSKSDDLPYRAISEQIDCFQRAKIKFPQLELSHFLYTKKGIEQATGEFTAVIHASMISGDTLLDMTAGLGFDAYFLSKQFNNVKVIEYDKVTYEILSHNLKLINHIQTFNEDSVSFLESDDSLYDWIYIDPDRRSKNQREIDIKQHVPDIITNFDLIRNHCRNLAIKLSPMTDIKACLNLFPSVSKVIVISIDNECKEILLIFEESKKNPPMIIAKMVNSKSKKRTEFLDRYETLVTKKLSDKDSPYLVEPDKAIIKAGLTVSFAQKNNLEFIHSHCDYLLADRPIKESARCYKIIKRIPYKVKVIKKELNNLNIHQANISKRNFPDRPEEIRKKLKLKDGGDYHLHFTKDRDGKHVCFVTTSVKKLKTKN